MFLSANSDFDLVATELKRIAGSACTAGLQVHFAGVPRGHQPIWMEDGFFGGAE